MKFNLDNRIGIAKARARLNFLIEKGARVDIIHKQGKFTLPQIKYVHLIIKYYGVQVGLNLSEAKTDFKNLSKDIFLYEKNSTMYLRSLATLDKLEMSRAIDRFLEYAEGNGIPLPRTDEREFIDEAMNEVETAQNFL